MNKSGHRLVSPARRATYEVRVEGRVEGHWSEWFSGLVLSHEAQAGGGETIIVLPDADAARLHGLLAHIGALNLTLVSVLRTAQEGTAQENGERSERNDLDEKGDA